MWPLPTTLEFLNISHNKLERLDSSIMEQLSSLKTLDVSLNQLNTLDGV